MSKCIDELGILSEREEILPIISNSVSSISSRFGAPEDFISRISYITKKDPLKTICECETIGPKNFLSALIVAPCTGNTLAKVANGVTDTPVTMAIKAHLRNNKPLILALASNDAMSANFKNLASLTERKNVYFVPLVQDDPKGKPTSLVADFSKIGQTLDMAIRGVQIRPLFL
jgi:dipicolinate synthase subunit B